MRILIVSDTHKYNGNLLEVLRNIEQVDMIIHCGDAEGSENGIREQIDCPLYIVAGNSDYFTELDKELVIDIGEKKALVTHGHYYHASMGTERLVDEAKARGVDIVIYGHTHRPHMEIEDGIVVLNPGSISYPRQNGKVPTYILMEVDEHDNIYYTLNYYG